MNQNIISEMNPTVDYPAQIPKIPRQQVVDTLRQKLKTNHEVLLYGPSHWGRSYLVQYNVQEDPGFQSDYESIFYLNFFTLRMVDPEALERESARWLIKDADKFEHYLKNSDQSNNQLLQRYLIDSFKDKKALLIIDRLELLPKTIEIRRWVKKFRQFLNEENIDTIWVDCCLSIEESRLAKWAGKVKSALELPCLSESELEHWLPHNMQHLADSVYDATGGNVAQIRDFFVFARNAKTYEAKLVDLFVETHAALYSRSCHYILQAFKKHPGTSIDKWRTPAESPIQEALRLSGVYRKDDRGISVISKLHEKRLSRVLTIKNLLLAGATLRLDAILRLFKDGTLPCELATELMINHLLSCIKNEQVFADLKKFMSSLHGFHCEFYFQENHRLIWFYERDNTPKLQMLHRFSTEFQQAFWSGHPTVMQEQYNTLQLFVPVVGVSGGVELMVSGQIPVKMQKTNIW